MTDVAFYLTDFTQFDVIISFLQWPSNVYWSEFFQSDTPPTTPIATQRLLVWGEMHLQSR